MQMATGKCRSVAPNSRVLRLSEMERLGIGASITSLQAAGMDCTLRITQKQSTHNEWKSLKDKKTVEFKARKAAKANSGNNSGSGAPASTPTQRGQKQMEVSNCLQTALATNLGVCEEDINKIINEYQGN
jgi:hypothetical protein